MNENSNLCCYCVSICAIFSILFAKKIHYNREPSSEHENNATQGKALVNHFIQKWDGAVFIEYLKNLPRELLSMI